MKMSPTILTEHDENRNNLHNVRKTEQSSPFSVINFVSKRPRIDKNHRNLISKLKDESKLMKMVASVVASPTSSQSESSAMNNEDTSSSFSSEHYTSSEITNSIKSEDDNEDYPMRNRSYSISSSGCSSSLEEVLPSIVSEYRCTPVNDSDFDDDGFRDDNTTRFSTLSYSVQNKSENEITQFRRTNTKGLVDIALRTIKLVRRNQELQAKLAQLQTETNAFIQSVMLNPENQSLKHRLEK